MCTSEKPMLPKIMCNSFSNVWGCHCLLLLLRSKFNTGIKPRLPPHQRSLGPLSLPPSASEHSCYALQGQTRKAAPHNEDRKSPYCHTVATVKILLYCFLIFKQSLFFIMYVWASHECLGKKKMASDPLQCPFSARVKARSSAKTAEARKH